MNRIFSQRNVNRASVMSALVVTLSLCLPAVSFAVNSPTPSGGNNGFCSRLANDESKVEGSISQRRDKVSSAWSAQASRLAELKQQAAQKVAEVRASVDAKRQQNFTKLEAKAKTPDEKAAVQTYETSVEQAVSIRRSTVDKARAAFNQGVMSAIDARHSEISSQMGDLVSGVDSAFATASSSCLGGESGQSVRQTLVASLKSARVTFVSERQNDSKIADQVHALATTRNAAVTAANNTLTASLKTAAQTLKAAFGKDSSEV